MKRPLDSTGHAPHSRDAGRKRQNTANGDTNASRVVSPPNNPGIFQIGVAPRPTTFPIPVLPLPVTLPRFQSAAQGVSAPANVTYSFWGQSHTPQPYRVPVNSIVRPAQSLFDRAVDQSTKLSLVKTSIPNYELPNGSCMRNTIEEVQVSIGQSYEAASDEIARLGNEVLTLRAERDAQKEEVERAKVREKTLEKKLAERKKEAEEEIDALKAETARLQSEVEASEVEASLQKQEQSELSARPAAQEELANPEKDAADIARFEASLNDSELEVAELRAELSALKTTDAKLRAQIAKLHTSYATFHSEYAELQTEHAAVVTENAEAIAKNAALYAENTTFRLRGLAVRHGTAENAIKVEES